MSAKTKLNGHSNHCKSGCIFFMGTKMRLLEQFGSFCVVQLISAMVAGFAVALGGSSSLAAGAPAALQFCARTCFCLAKGAPSVSELPTIASPQHWLYLIGEALSTLSGAVADRPKNVNC
jgi:hypothetical protein